MKKIIHKYNECLGCGNCVAVCPAFWEFDDAGKVKPKKCVKNAETGNYEFEINEEEISCNKEAADICPVQAIEIIS